MQAGVYFVTICTQDRQCLFGEVVNGEMQLNDVGEIFTACWHDLPDHFPHVALDAFVVMPNHVHGIIFINDQVNKNITSQVHNRRGEAMLRPYTPFNIPYTASGTRSGSLGAIIQNFKSYSTRHINTLCDTPGLPVWQRNYYDHIIRNDADLDRTRHYIVTNPLQWDGDQLHPDNPSKW